jgi:hypothetical protein
MEWKVQDAVPKYAVYVARIRLWPNSEKVCSAQAANEVEGDLQPGRLGEG